MAATGAALGDDRPLSLVPWGAGLAIYYWRSAPEPAGLRFLVWSSVDGLRWHRQGGLDLRPTGDLRGCGFRNDSMTSAGNRLVVSSSCAVPHGAGGDVGPGFGTIASAASAPSAGIPTYTWTSRDGHRWTRHRVLLAKDYQDEFEWFGLFRSVGDGIAAVTTARHPRLLWSADGATFHTVSGLPGQAEDWAEDVDATTGPDGVPVSWLLALVHQSDDGPATRTIWRLHPGDAWEPVLASDLIDDVDVITDGDRVVMVGTLAVAGSDDTVLMETFLSRDGATTWTSSVDLATLTDCQPHLAVLVVTAVMGCVDGSGPGLRFARVRSAP